MNRLQAHRRSKFWRDFRRSALDFAPALWILAIVGLYAVMQKDDEDAVQAAENLGLELVTSDPLYECPYCYRLRTSQNGTGSDVECCGEIGHAILFKDKEAP